MSYRGTNRKSVFICLTGIIILPEMVQFLTGNHITKAHNSYQLIWQKLNNP